MGVLTEGSMGLGCDECVDFGLTLAGGRGLGHLGEMAAPEPSYLEVSGRPGRPDIPYVFS